MSIRRIHPGVFIKDALETMEMTSREFSMRTGISERTLSSIINEKGSITLDVAYKLAQFFDNTVNYWTNLQTQYDMYLLENKREKELEEDWMLVKSMRKYLVDYNYISIDDDKEVAVSKIRKIVGVNNLTFLNQKDTFVCFKEQSTKNEEKDYFYQNFWIALALNEARKKNGAKYDKEKMKDAIPKIRRMTVMNPEDFYMDLEKTLSECGISFVLLPYLSKSNVYGATKWFSKDSVMLAISNRGGKADLFWFTLFHEISHVLMEHRRETLINIKDIEDSEADNMAKDMLIPRKEWDKFISRKNYSLESINKFSNEIGILPCIVLGRLHKEKMIPYGIYDKQLSVSYKITMIN